jgi:rod shape determining protein RodA
MARFLSAREAPPRTSGTLWLPAPSSGVPAGLVVLQPDLGTALAFVGILFACLYWAGTSPFLLFLLASPGLALILSFEHRRLVGLLRGLDRLIYLFRYRLYLAESVGVLLANLAAGTIANPLWSQLADYQKNRLLVFLDPGMDPRGAGWNLIQSKVAIGSGGLTGRGSPRGRRSGWTSFRSSTPTSSSA